MPVEIVHWNPKRPTKSGLISRHFSRRLPVGNFGDLLGPEICRELVERAGGDFLSGGRRDRLLSIGSIMHMARPGDVVWGTGVNGKALERHYELDRIRVCAVRGPLTRDFLRDRGLVVPEVYGDPGLLVGRLWSRSDLRREYSTSEIAIVPNLHDLHSMSASEAVVSPLLPLWECVGRIAASEFVVGSSLHGIIVAESLGIPARFVSSAAEPEFKYRDYFEGTGRRDLVVARSVAEAISMGPQATIDWDEEALLSSFPYGLWEDE